MYGSSILDVSLNGAGVFFVSFFAFFFLGKREEGIALRVCALALVTSTQVHLYSSAFCTVVPAKYMHIRVPSACTCDETPFSLVEKSTLFLSFSASFYLFFCEALAPISSLMCTACVGRAPFSRVTFLHCRLAPPLFYLQNC